MNMIQERINQLKPYFRGIKVTENYKIVEFNLKKTWSIQTGDDIDVQSNESKEKNNVLISMFYSETKTFDEIIDYVEENVINYNIEIEEKENLLKAKVEELKRVFEVKSLDELNKLKFTTEDASLKLTKTNKKTEETNNNKVKEKENGVAEELS